jgi:anti-sigma factor RsiW
MTSHHVLDRLPLWVEGDLTGQELLEVERHLAECPSCQEAAQRLTTSQSWLREALVSPFEASDQERLRRKVMDQIRAEAPARPARRLTVRPALLAACAASLLVASLVWQQQRHYERQALLPMLPPLPKAAEPPMQTDPQPNKAEQRSSPSANARPRPGPTQASESPPSGDPARIEFQTSDPNIRIIWLAQAKPLPDPTAPEEP